MSKGEAFDRVQRPQKTPAAVKPKERWGGDVIVDMLQRYQLPYATLNPGASYRGLHDSIVNYGGNSPERASSSSPSPAPAPSSSRCWDCRWRITSSPN